MGASGRAGESGQAGLAKRGINCNGWWGLSVARRAPTRFRVPRAGPGGRRPGRCRRPRGRAGGVPPRRPAPLHCAWALPAGWPCCSSSRQRRGGGPGSAALHRDGRGRGQTGGECGAGQWGGCGAGGRRGAVPWRGRAAGGALPEYGDVPRWGCRGAAPRMLCWGL